MVPGKPKEYYFFFINYYDYYVRAMREPQGNDEGDQSMHIGDDTGIPSLLNRLRKIIAGSRRKCLRGEKAKNYMKTIGLHRLAELLDDARICITKEDSILSEVKISADKISYVVDELPEPFASMKLDIPVDILLRYDSKGALEDAVIEIIAPWYKDKFFRTRITPKRNIHEYVDNASYRILTKIAGNLKTQLYALYPLLGEEKVEDYVLLLDGEAYIGRSNQEGLLRIESRLRPLSSLIHVSIAVPLIVPGTDSGLREEKYVDITKLFPMKEIIYEVLPECNYDRLIGKWEYKGYKIKATFNTDKAMEEFMKSSKVFKRLRETHAALLDDVRAADGLEPITESTSTTVKAIIHLFNCGINAIEYFLFGKRYFNPQEPLSLVKTLVKTIEYIYHSGYMHGGNLIYVIPRTIRLLEYLYSRLIVGRALLYGGKVPYLLRAPAAYTASHLLRIIAENARVDEENLTVELYGVKIPVTDRFLDYILYLRRNILPRLRELGRRDEEVN